MLTLRAARWPDDLSLLAGLDTSFTTDRLYRLTRDEFGFRLVEEAVDPPLHKDYGSIPGIDDQIPKMDCGAVAEEEGEPVGFAAAEFEAWNRCLIVRHLYVAADRRRSGVGRALLDHLDGFARQVGARCLWLA